MGSSRQPPFTTAPDWSTLDWAAHTHSARVGDTEVSYVSLGEGPQPAVVLIHGLGGSWTAWIETIGPLARHRRVIAVDLPGFGMSPPAPAVTTVSSYARVVEALCDQLRISSAVVAGSSLGGWVAAELALRAPGLVERLVLVDAVGVPPTWRERVKLVATLRVAGLMSPLMGRYKARILASDRLRRQLFGFAFAHPERLDPALLRYQLPDRPSPVFQRVMTAGIRSWSPSWFDRVADISVPALVVWGGSDRQLPIRHAHQWLDRLSHARLEVIPDAGHLPMLEQPTAFNRLVTTFIDEPAGPQERIAG